MKYFCDKCKDRPAKKLHTFIAAHYCASFSVRLLIALNMLSLSWVWRHPGTVLEVNMPIMRKVCKPVK